MRVSDKWKAVVGAVGGIFTALGAALADNVIDISEGGNVIALVIAAGALVYGLVYAAPANKEE